MTNKGTAENTSEAKPSNTKERKDRGKPTPPDTIYRREERIPERTGTEPGLRKRKQREREQESDQQKPNQRGSELPQSHRKLPTKETEPPQSHRKLPTGGRKPPQKQQAEKPKEPVTYQL